MTAPLSVVATQPEPPHVFSAAKFLADYAPEPTIVDGLPMVRGSLVAITGQTGHAKTTLSALLQVALRTGSRFAGREVTPGSVMVLAGENPHDYAGHLRATLQDQGLEASQLRDPTTFDNILVVPGTFSVTYELDHLASMVAAHSGELVAVFVDTSAAYNLAEDENDNVAMRRHASALRELTTLPGRPTVFVLCHPTKSAQKDNLLPRGGGSFLAEIDANLTVWKDEAGIVSLHWSGKIRGSNFDPIRFEIVPVELDGLKDQRGNPIFSTCVRHAPDERAEVLEAKALDDENRLLIAMQRKPGGSIADLAMAAGFATGVGVPHKSKVARLLRKLADQGLVSKGRTGTWTLTSKGRNEANELP